jgi:hypothetical protein
MNHWLRLFFKRPKLATAKVCLNVVNSILRFSQHSSFKPASVKNLEEMILQNQFQNDDRKIIDRELALKK